MTQVMDTLRNVGGFQLGITFFVLDAFGGEFLGINNHVHI